MNDSIYTRSVVEPEAGPVARVELAKVTRPTLSTEPPAPRKSTKIALYAGIALFAFISFLLIHYSKAASSPDSAGVRTATAERKDFAERLRLTGTIEAVRSRPILAPKLEGSTLNAMVITRLTRAGTNVKQGDILVQFDQQAQMNDYLDKKAAFQDLEDQLIEKRAVEDMAHAKDDTDLKQAEDALRRAELEVSKSEIVSRIDAEKNQEAFEEAGATLKQLQETFKLKRQAAAADLQTLQIQSDRARATMVYSQSNAQKMTIASPMDGVVVLNMVWLGGRMGEVQEGDQIRPGVPFMKVVDPSEMNIRATVNEADLLRLSAGQEALIYLDAYPGLTFPATLTDLSPLGHSGQFSGKVHSFSALFMVHGNNPKLMPDLSAAVDVDLKDEKNVVVVPRGSVRSEKGQDYVWLKTGMGFEKRSVKTGAKNDLEIVIDSGLSAGDVVRENAADVRGAS